MDPQFGEAIAQGSGYALASAAAVAMMLVVGFLVLTRSPSSPVNRSFMGIIVACCLWMGGRAGVFGSLTTEEAASWYSLSFVGLAFLPSAIYLFSTTAAAAAKQRLKTITVSLAFSAGLCMFQFVRPDLVAAVLPNAYTGWYPRFGPGGYVLVAFLGVGTVVSSAILFRSHVPRSASQTREKKRVRLILLGLVAGYTAAFDLLPAFGLNHPPVAHFSLVVGIAFCGYAVGRYRVVILTPSSTGEAIVSSMEEALFFMDVEGRVLFTNRALRQLLSYREEELSGASHEALFDPGHAPEIDLGPGGRGIPRAQDARLRSRSGRTVDAAVTVTPFFDEEGETSGFVGLAQEKAEEVRLEGRVQDLEQELNQLLDNSMFGVYVLSEGRLEFINEKAATILGYSSEDLRGSGFDRLIHPEDLDLVRQRVALRERGENPENHYVLRALHKNGGTRRVEIFSTSIQSGDRHFVLGFAIDVTERHQIEDELRRVTEFSEGILRNIPLGVLMVDCQGWVVYVNPKASDLLGEDPAPALLGRHVRDTLLGREPGLVSIMGEDFPSADGAWAVPQSFLLEGKDGGTIGVSVLAAPSTLGAGEGYLLLIDEPSGRREVGSGWPFEVHAQWVGVLLGALARDFEGLLGGILGYASLAKALLPGEEKVSGYIVAITQLAQRAVDLTNRLGSSRKVWARATSDVAVNGILRETLRRLEPRLNPSVEVSTTLVEGLPPVDGDPDQLQEMLFQLGLNALEAMPEGGRLDVSTEEVYLDEAMLDRHPGTRPGPHVCILVRDSGIGIPEENQASVFDPFFTSGKAGGSAGIGLWLARSIARDNGGTIDLESTPHAGSVFRVYLPASPRKASSAPEQTARPEQSVGRVLIVDDEPSVREVASELLQEIGYEVLTASDGVDALEVLETTTRVDVVILDMVMPRLNGEETFARLRKIDPAIRVIISSGYTEDEKVRELLGLGALGFVQKPYRVQTLAKAVEEAIETRGTQPVP